MSLLLSFVRHSKKFFYLIAVCIFTSCARKNSRIYDFSEKHRSNVSRLNLPYLRRVSGFFTDEHRQCNLLWTPVVIQEIPVDCSLQGYNIYAGTALKLFGRKPIFSIPPSTYSCDVVLEDSSKEPFFAVAPVFFDQDKNEVVGLLTIAKF